MIPPRASTRIISTSSVPTRQSGFGKLHAVRGPDQGELWTLPTDPFRIGSGSGCFLRLTDPTVSRQHLEAEVGAQGLVVRDRGSTNGSFVRGARFREIVLGFGEEIQVGHTFLKFVPDEQSVDSAPVETTRYGSLIGQEPRMRQLFALLDDVAQSTVTVLLEGETGTGKELLAEEIHAHSARAKGPLVIFDCASVPRDLIESALFGHVKGSFTGAISDRKGAFLEANGGTLFLDEIGELDIELQPTLLRALDKRVVRPVGSDSNHKVDVRVVAATNRDLREEVSARRFREDLYYRLAVVRIPVPALRERLADIPLLVRHFVSQMAPQRLSEIRDADLADLLKHRWPGNIRELRNLVERVVALSRNGPLVFSEALPSDAARAAAMGAVNVDLPFKDAKADVVERFESRYLSALLERHEGNLSAAARAAKLDRKHLRELLRKYDLRDPEG